MEAVTGTPAEVEHDYDPLKPKKDIKLMFVLSCAVAYCLAMTIVCGVFMGGSFNSDEMPSCYSDSSNLPVAELAVGVTNVS